MNSVSLFVEQAERHPDRMALWLPREPSLSFSELRKRAGAVQKHFGNFGMGPGDSVLFMDPLSPRLYALLTACLASGACVIFVEPWMKPERIAQLIQKIRPRFFVAGLKGRAWGLRIKSIREIPHWVWPHRAWNESPKELDVVSVTPEAPGVLTFTSGTTGLPKGVVRAHGYLQAQHRVLNDSLSLGSFEEPDLCIFANFALANLASGRGSLIIPPTWKARHLRLIDQLPKQLQPSTLTAGPAFLERMLEIKAASSLRDIHIGGALSDISLFEKAMKQWPSAHFSHLYGSSEAEPVAIAEAREAVEASKDCGYFQTLFIGRPVPAISAKLTRDTLWIAGPHVGPEYWGDSPENKTNKQRIEGTLWHNMGDRIEADDKGWWYLGRSQQSREVVLTEQKIYARLGHSRAFLVETPKGLWLFGESLLEGLAQKFQLAGQSEVTILRDARHRARIDRFATLKKGAPWALG